MFCPRRRRIFGFRLVDRELSGIPLAAQAHFIDLTRLLTDGDVPAGDLWRMANRVLWIYEMVERGVAYRMAVEFMAEGWVMLWACGSPAVFRRRLEQRLAMVG